MLITIPGIAITMTAESSLRSFRNAHHDHFGIAITVPRNPQFESTPSKEYWVEKIRRNVFRDCSATDFLVSQGWTVLRFWESDVLKNLDGCVSTCLGAIQSKADSDPFWIIPSRTFAEFFAGIGLMRMGLERQGWRSEFANDNDPKKLEMYRAHPEMRPSRLS